MPQPSKPHFRPAPKTFGSSSKHGFLLKLPDGTCAKVVAGEVRDVWVVGERRLEWQVPAEPASRRMLA